MKKAKTKSTANWREIGNITQFLGYTVLIFGAANLPHQQCPAATEASFIFTCWLIGLGVLIWLVGYCVTNYANKKEEE